MQLANSVSVPPHLQILEKGWQEFGQLLPPPTTYRQKTCRCAVTRATRRSSSPESSRTSAGRCLAPVSLVKGKASRTRSPGSNRIIDAVALAVAAQEILVGQSSPVCVLRAFRHENDHPDRLFLRDLGGEFVGHFQVQVCVWLGFEFQRLHVPPPSTRAAPSKLAGHQWIRFELFSPGKPVAPWLSNRRSETAPGVVDGFRSSRTVPLQGRADDSVVPTI